MDIVEDEYEPMSTFHDLSMIFFNRIGEKKIELLYDIDPKMSRKLYGDSQRIRQIILNLMNNAIKFTDEGFVKLKVEVTTLDMENVELCFKIQDSGQGIKKGDIDGIIHLTAFGCGPDSIIGRLMEGDCDDANLPFLTLRVDEHTGDNHTQTRLEAYIDMLKMRKFSSK